MSKSSSNENLSLVQPEEQGSEYSGSDCDEFTQKFNQKLNEAEERKLLDSKTKNLIEKYTPDVIVHTGSKGIGQAEWLPDYQVAKVIVEARILVYCGLKHTENFFFLFAEEALFLLNVGELALTINSVSLSLEDAKNLLICTKEDKLKGDLRCTMQEYLTFEYFCRLGYVARRCNIFPPALKPMQKLNLAPSEVVPMHENTEKSDDFAENSGVIEEPHEPIGNFQDFMSNLPKRAPFFERNLSSANKSSKLFDFSLFANSKEDVTIPHVDSNFVHEIVDSDYDSEDTDEGPYAIGNKDVHDGIIPDKRTNKKRKSFSYNNRGYTKAASESKSWAEFKRKITSRKYNRSERDLKKLKLLSSGKTKPLVDLNGEINSINVLIGKTKIFKSFNHKEENKSKLSFNVYQGSKNGSISKSKPGKPLFRVYISQDKNDLFEHNQNSLDNIPIKTVFVVNEEVHVLGTDSIVIPDYVVNK